MAQKQLFRFCMEHGIELGDLVVKGKEYTEPCNKLIFYHGSKKGIEGDIAPISRKECNFGAKTIVVHPKQHLYYGNHKNELAEINAVFYQSLIPYCEKYGIKVAVENMYQTENGLDDGCIVPSTCADPKEFCEYVDAVRSEWIVACLDIGHSVLTGNKLDDTVLALGNRLQALHVHDVDDVHDNHAVPYMCNIDFQKLIDSLKKIHYQGDVTFEPCGYFWDLPKELVPSGICLMRDIGRYLVSQIVD